MVCDELSRKLKLLKEKESLTFRLTSDSIEDQHGLVCLVKVAGRDSPL